MSDIKEDDIQKRAYALWEAAGRPEGSHENHWHQAREELWSSTVPKPQIKVRKASAEKPVKTAAKKSDADEAIVAPAAIKGRGKKASTATTNGTVK
ncbi:hypothetical protein QO002_004763 [Pararhizobium capsulatum DSM 1112]|uniref:DUF2934 domain-containing protein n=1 Tax=Pararhizobium capsulatum DSM 1112 TaxID=1121113 RepID=A0ABU0BWC4_9HYPH|nr:DUF2934 domain-containing protein [Pararhizobium capsulatum]MDQ0322557.1 hypothetical protein [Pararhizobium capsulatum DSM 1112]